MNRATVLGRLIVRMVTLLGRWRYVLLWGWMALLVVINPGRGTASHRGADWGWFVLGSDLLFGRHPQGATEPGGLHLYANYPELHTGPLSFVAAAVFRILSPDNGKQLAILALAALGPLIVFSVERAALAARGVRDTRNDPKLPLATLAGGAVFLLAWSELAVYWGHIAEALVLIAAAVVVWCAATRSRPMVAAAAIGLACGVLSSGVLLLPLLARFPRRVALRATAVAVVLAAAVWLPFFVADPGTLDAAHAKLYNVADSGLRVFGVDSNISPDWLRPVQVLVALTLGGLAVARGRWAAALLVAVGARLALDPAVFSFYTGGLVLGGLVWDLTGRWLPIPVWTFATYAALELVPRIVDDPQLRGLARVVVALAAATAALALPRLRPRPTAATSPAGR